MANGGQPHMKFISNIVYVTPKFELFKIGKVWNFVFADFKW